jgi:hypothetical protein
MGNLESTPAIPERYEVLRDMDSVTDAMFNSIVGFQERLHPAWNSQLSFAERIKDLPLHSLVFSNPDRDPERFAHTVAPYYPLRDEIRQIVDCARRVADDPVICDVHGKNGFLGSLLAREGVRVVGLRDPADKPNQIEDFCDTECYRWSDSSIETVDFVADVAFSSWMPSGVNRTPAILALKPRLIVFVHTDHIDASSGTAQTGTPEAFTDLPENYCLIANWSIVRPQDLFHEIWPDLTPSIEEIRQVKIYADRPYHDIDVQGETGRADPYDWERELRIALTAHEAKHHLRSLGFPV